MRILERVCQAILFETLAILLSLILVKVFSHSQTTADRHVMAMLIAISLIAMVWAFIYNLLFDRIFLGDKTARSLYIRILHSLLFEVSLLAMTLPLIMWVLNIGFWQALMMDVSLALTILVYGFIFYWCYDHLRLKIIQHFNLSPSK